MKNLSTPIYNVLRWLPLVAGCLVACSSLQAQSITWAFVNAAGFVDGADASLRWTIGEPLTTEVRGDDGSLRVGFFPFPFIESGTTATTSFHPEMEISISPNPAVNTLHVQVPGDDPFQLRILSINGVPAMSARVTNDTSLDIRALPSGYYVLYIIDAQGAFNSISFIKS